tara:strand:+ start:27 stop:503 length:477 start_codon:yes stop_codon:yes gene_type:complete
LKGKKKNRPEIKFEIYNTRDKTIWKMFAKHHYLSHSHNNAANVYIAFVNEQLAGFISILHFPHAKVKNIKRVHRLVVMPDFQGIGIGVRLLEYIGKKYINNKYRYRITTSAPSLINYFKNNVNWLCSSYGRKKNHGGTLKVGKFGSENRITTSWEYKL